MSYGQPTYEIIVQDRPWNWTFAIYLINRGGEGVFLGRVNDGKLTWEKTKEGADEDEPTLLLNHDLWEIMKQTMTEKHERDKHTVEAELGATRYHLEDMRKLVFNQKAK